MIHAIVASAGKIYSPGKIGTLHCMSNVERSIWCSLARQSQIPQAGTETGMPAADPCCFLLPFRREKYSEYFREDALL